MGRQVLSIFSLGGVKLEILVEDPFLPNKNSEWNTRQNNVQGVGQILLLIDRFDHVELLNGLNVIADEFNGLD